MTNQYPNPPTVEALVDFGFLPGREWNIIVPGQIAERVRADYPLQETVSPGFPPSLDDALRASGAPFVERIRLKAPDGSRLIQLARDRLVVNQLRPYPGWERLKPQTLQVLDHYRAVAEPSGLIDVSIRYINQFDVLAGSDRANLFTFRPSLDRPLGPLLNSFTLAGQFRYEDGDRLDIQLATIDATEEGRDSYVLDLGYSAATGHAPSFDQVAMWLDTAHGRIEDAFEQTIGADVRQRMDQPGSAR